MSVQISHGIYTEIQKKNNLQPAMCKWKSAMMIFERHASLKYKFGNRNFVSTVGINASTVQKYIREQDKQD